MKMIYNGTPIKSLNIKHFEVSTNDCTAIPSDLQAGVTCVSKGKKITGTGKCFEFAQYGSLLTNSQGYIPTLINVVEISSTECPIKSYIGFDEMIGTDFTAEKTVGVAVIDNVEYPITINIVNNILTFNCDKTILLEFFYGRDNYT